MKTNIEAELLPTVVEVLALPGDHLIVVNGVVVGVRSRDEAPVTITVKALPAPEKTPLKRLHFDERLITGYLRERCGYTTKRLNQLLGFADDAKARASLTSWLHTQVKKGVVEPTPETAASRYPAYRYAETKT